MQPQRDNYWYLVSRVQGPVKHLKMHKAAPQQRTKCQLCQGWDSLVQTCSGWVTFQQNCSLGKCKTTVCKKKKKKQPSIIILSLPVSISFGYFFKVYPNHYFFKCKIHCSIFMFNTQPLSATLRNSQGVLLVFYFVYLDVCRGRLILLLKKFVFSCLATKVIYRRNKSQETTISTRVSSTSCTRRNPGGGCFNLCIFQQGDQVVNKN